MKFLKQKERDPFLCAAGSFFFPGLGQVYCGRIARGIVFLTPAVLLTVPYAAISLALYSHLFGIQSTWFSVLSSLIGLISQVVNFIVRVIATYDAYKIAQESVKSTDTFNQDLNRVSEI